MLLQDGVHRVAATEGASLLEVWEASVRATHHFLTEEDIQRIKPLVLPELFALDHLLCVRDTEGSLVAFLGVTDRKLEALFLHPSCHRIGIGRRLVRHAVLELHAVTVDVNEQNPEAIAFYRRLGYEIERRSATDSIGQPFPLLHMRKHDVNEW